MLSNDRLIELFTHPDRAVRTKAARVLADAHDPSPATAGDIIKAIERFPDRAYPCLWSRLPDFKHDDASIQWLLHRLHEELRLDEKGIDSDDLLDRDINVRATLEQTLASLDFDQLRRHRHAIAASVTFPEFSARIDRRLSLADHDAETLWQVFNTWANKGHDGKSPDDGERLDAYQAMARHADVLGDRALTALASSSKDWREWHLIEAAGWMRRRDATPLLLRIMLEDDDDSDIGEPLMDAMSRIGDPTVIPALTEGIDDRSHGFKLYAGEVLERLRHPESEVAALRLLNTSEDPDTIAVAARALVELGTADDHALGMLREFASEEKFDSTWGDLREELIILYQMLDRELPEAMRWRRAIAADRLARRSLRDRLERMRPAPGEVNDRPLPLIETSQREQPKIGRNDKCPCGSGKKYKACCLNVHQVVDRV